MHTWDTSKYPEEPNFYDYIDSSEREERYTEHEHEKRIIRRMPRSHHAIEIFFVKRASRFNRNVGPEPASANCVLQVHREGERQRLHTRSEIADSDADITAREIRREPRKVRYSQASGRWNLSRLFPFARRSLQQAPAQRRDPRQASAVLDMGKALAIVIDRICRSRQRSVFAREIPHASPLLSATRNNRCG